MGVSWFDLQIQILLRWGDVFVFLSCRFNPVEVERGSSIRGKAFEADVARSLVLRRAHFSSPVCSRGWKRARA